jgi:acetyl esterase/lipase
MQNFGNGLKEYLHKLADTKNLLRLITGKVNLKIIFQSLIHKLKLQNRYPKIQPKSAGGNFGVLFIYGGCDPIVKESCEYYTKKCRQSGIEYQLQIIPKANHSFFHYEWKQRIFEIASDWLKNTSEATK